MLMGTLSWEASLLSVIRRRISGSFSNVNVVNSPAQTISVSNPGPLVISGVNIDNCGEFSLVFPASNASVLRQREAIRLVITANTTAGHNIDRFDASKTDLVSSSRPGLSATEYVRFRPSKFRR